MMTEVTTYPQDWPAYNRAQCEEKILFLELLHDLTSQIPRQDDNPSSYRLRDMIFCCTLKTYLNFSARRTMCDIKFCADKGYIEKAPHFNTIFNYFRKPELEPILELLVEKSALPLTQIENIFTVDGSGFSTSLHAPWSQVKYGTMKKMHKNFLKVVLMSGTKTNIVSSVEILFFNEGEFKTLSTLLEKTMRNFKVLELSADKAYSGKANYDLATLNSVNLYVPFKKDATGKARGSYAWMRAYKYFSENKEEFMQHYHLRSNAEAVFSMIKRKFGGYLRTRNLASQRNEILCKILCHNLCVLVQEMFKQNISCDFNSVVQEPAKWLK